MSNLRGSSNRYEVLWICRELHPPRNTVTSCRIRESEVILFVFNDLAPTSGRNLWINLHVNVYEIWDHVSSRFRKINPSTSGRSSAKINQHLFERDHAGPIYSHTGKPWELVRTEPDTRSFRNLDGRAMCRWFDSRDRDEGPRIPRRMVIRSPRWEFTRFLGVDHQISPIGGDNLARMHLPLLTLSAFITKYVRRRTRGECVTSRRRRASPI
jgi:hypothetical protein